MDIKTILPVDKSKYPEFVEEVSLSLTEDILNNLIHSHERSSLETQILNCTMNRIHKLLEFFLKYAAKYPELWRGQRNEEMIERIFQQVESQLTTKELTSLIKSKKEDLKICQENSRKPIKREFRSSIEPEWLPVELKEKIVHKHPKLISFSNKGLFEKKPDYKTRMEALIDWLLLSASVTILQIILFLKDSSTDRSEIKSLHCVVLRLRSALKLISHRFPQNMQNVISNINEEIAELSALLSSTLGRSIDSWDQGTLIYLAMLNLRQNIDHIQYIIDTLERQDLTVDPEIKLNFESFLSCVSYVLKHVGKDWKVKTLCNIFGDIKDIGCN